MFRRAINFLAGFLGGSVVGRRAVLTSGEGPAASQLKGLGCRVVSLNENPANGPEMLVVSLSESVQLNGELVSFLLLVPRHSGYGAKALLVTEICVYVFAADSPALGEIPDHSKMIAMMNLRIDSKVH